MLSFLIIFENFFLYANTYVRGILFWFGFFAG